MKAVLSHYRQSPRKVRLLADMIRGKDVAHASRILSFADKKSAPALKKLLDSAVANARNAGISVDGLIVKEVSVNAGLTMHRYMPRARGSAFPIRHRTSRVHIVLAGKNGDVTVDAEEVKTEEKPKKTAKSAQGRSASGGKATAKKTAKKTAKPARPGKATE
jgi:large subunit ribosomal protein L22